VDHRVDLVRLEDFVEAVGVAHVALVEQHGLASDAFDAHKALLVRVAQIVDNDHIVPRVEQLDHRVAADVANAAGHEHVERLAAGRRVHQRTAGGAAADGEARGPYRRRQRALHPAKRCRSATRSEVAQREKRERAVLRAH
jgi:hypothetical protein